MASLTQPQRAAINRLSRLPHAIGNVHATIGQALQRKRYADELRNGKYQLTPAGLRYAATGETIQGSN